MHFKLFAVAATAALFLLMPARADAACCDQHTHKALATKAAPCCDMPCCSGDVNVLDVMMASMERQLEPSPPVRQRTEVWFHRPVMVGRTIMQGRYVIEHDNDRMARGEPCTHIYAYEDQEKPVAAFHCVHLERDRASKNTVVLISTGDGWQKLTEFQFAGETASHGYPTGR